MTNEFTEVVIRKGPYEAILRIYSNEIYDSDLKMIQNFTHHFHGICSYNQRQGDRPEPSSVTSGQTGEKTDD